MSLPRNGSSAAGAMPAFKGYRGYPKTLCTSLNNQVVHGIPSKDVVLKEGDIISVDVGAIVDGFYGDAARTFPVGTVAPEAERLIKVTEEALSRGSPKRRPGNRLYDISAAVQNHAESNGFSVVRDFVGHGIGRNMHEDPQIPNFGERRPGTENKAGMVFAIEPMVNKGGSGTVVLEDGWTAVTADGSLSAHFEHTIAVTAGRAMDIEPEIEQLEVHSVKRGYGKRRFHRSTGYGSGDPSQCHVPRRDRERP